jgi:16S rRNA processing protein RimM
MRREFLMSDDLVCVGSVVGAFGVRGEIRLKSFCAVPEDIETYSPLLSEDGSKSYSISLIGSVKNGFTARMDGVATKEQADAMHGVRLFTKRDQLPSLPDDEYYYADLIGLEVLDTGGTILGRVKDVLNHGAGDLLEINGPDLKASVLLPFTLAAVPTVDLAAGRIIVDPPDGLL